MERSSFIEMASNRRPSRPVTVVACNNAFKIASSVASAAAANNGDIDAFTNSGVSTGVSLERGRRTRGSVENAMT